MPLRQLVKHLNQGITNGWGFMLKIHGVNKMIKLFGIKITKMYILF